ncbi:MAG: ATP-binding SpoIIE family protein phosphatase [Pseudomonadota bacterium]
MSAASASLAEHATLQEHVLQEHNAAKAVMDRVVHSGCLDSDNIRYLISPLALFNGDVLLADLTPAGDLNIFMGDFTGHGLTAGIGAMPLADVFYTMTRKGFDLNEVITECNRKLHWALPIGQFCCATVVSVQSRRSGIEFWCGGLPDGYLIESNGAAMKRLRSHALPLGIVGADRFRCQTQRLAYRSADRLLLFTDGLLENRGIDGSHLSSEMVESLVLGQPSASSFDRLLAANNDRRISTSPSDDVTLIEVELNEAVSPQAALGQTRPTFASEAPPPEQDWRFSYELRAASLRGFSPLPMIQQLVSEIPGLRPHVGAIYCVLAETFSNALEHGVLQLASTDKHSADGFDAYYRRREQRLRDLRHGYVRFEFECLSDGRRGRLIIRVMDSGDGFDYERTLAEPRAQRYHGRGIGLLQRLATRLCFLGNGNIVEVEFEWS